MRDVDRGTPGTDARKRPSRARQWATFGALAFFFAGALGFVFLSFFFGGAARDEATFRVRSRSMEPAWYGPHFVQVCSECGANIVSTLDVGTPGIELNVVDDVESSPEVRSFRETVRTTLCPECGFAQPLTSCVLYDGDLLHATRIRKGAALKRWSPVVFRDASGAYSLKRIVAFEGESVVVHNGDVFVDGAPTPRTLEEILATTSFIVPTRETLTTERLTPVHVTATRSSTPSGDVVKHLPTAISSESPWPCFNGGNATAPEVVRDFILRFRWNVDSPGNADAVVFARRPERAWALEYFPASGDVVVRSLEFSGETSASGKPFEELDLEDFAESGTASVNVGAALSYDVDVTVAMVDGEMILAFDGVERARFDLGDVASDATAAISAPFVILGEVSRASKVDVFRDLHYSSMTDVETEVPQGCYFALGDNSPASVDSRFPEVGAISVENVRYVVAPEEAGR